MSTTRPLKPFDRALSAALAPARPAPMIARLFSRSTGISFRGAVERGGEPGQRQRAEQQAEVAQGDVVEVSLHQQVHDDAAEPCGDEITAEPGSKGDDEPRDDLDDTDREHRLVGVAG